MDAVELPPLVIAFNDERFHVSRTMNIKSITCENEDGSAEGDLVWVHVFKCLISGSMWYVVDCVSLDSFSIETGEISKEVEQSLVDNARTQFIKRVKESKLE